MKKAIIGVLSVLILFAGCKKDNEAPQVSVQKLYPSLYPMLFNNGSYWIFKDTITNATDSIVLTSASKMIYHIQPIAPGAGSPGDLEYYKDNYFSYYTNSLYLELLLVGEISRGNFDGNYIYFSTKMVGDTGVGAKTVAVLDSIKIQNKTYRTVVKMKLTTPSFTGYYYFADNVGIIRKETTVNNIVTDRWDLIRNHTIMLPYQ